jgi:hypothetical protein
MYRKKAGAVILTITLVVGMMTGCGKQDITQADTTTEAATETLGTDVTEGT